MRNSAMLLRCVAMLLVLAVAGVGFAQSTQIVFKKVDYYWLNDDGDEKNTDARLVLHMDSKAIGLYDEKNGVAKATYAVIPYENITGITYEKSAHSRIAMGILLSPIAFFMKGKKHWLTITFTGVEAVPAGYVYIRLDKKNFQQVLAAVEAQTGIEIERLEEG